MNYEVYIGLTEQNRPKTYLVFPKGKLDMNQAKRYFRCSLSHLKLVGGYVWKDELYLNCKPHSRSKFVAVVYYV